MSANKPGFNLSAAVTIAFWAILVAAGVYSIFFSSRRDPGDQEVVLRNYRMVEAFSLTDQHGKAVSRADLDGKVWVANFFFTSCSTQCLVLSERMYQLQTRFAGNPDVAFVSISVDPQTDTPERLATYAQRYKAGPRWSLLTGKPQEVDRLIKGSFLLPVARTDAERNQIYLANLVHSDRMAVVDRLGVVRYYADGMAPGVLTAIATAVEKVLAEAQEPDLPAPAPAAAPKPLP